MARRRRQPRKMGRKEKWFRVRGATAGAGFCLGKIDGRPLDEIRRLGVPGRMAGRIRPRMGRTGRAALQAACWRAAGGRTASGLRN